MVYVIIPVWNAEKVLGQCLESLFAQTYKNFQIVAINDGSSDNSFALLKEYQKEHDNLTVLTQKNGGPSVARNTGLDYVSSQNPQDDDCVIFVDADDWVEPDFLECLTNMMKNKNVAVAGCGYEWQKRSEKHFKNRKFKTLTFDKTEGLEQVFVDKYFYGYLWNKMLKVKYLKGQHFDTELFICEDLLFITNYILSLPENCQLMHCTKKIYHYIRSNSSLSSFNFSPRKLRAIDTADKVKLLIEKTNNEELKIYRNSWEFLLLIEYIFYTRKYDKKIHAQLKSRARKFLKDYKSVKSEYTAFRRYANLIFWAL